MCPFDPVVACVRGPHHLLRLWRQLQVVRLLLRCGEFFAELGDLGKVFLRLGRGLTVRLGRLGLTVKCRDLLLDGGDLRVDVRQPLFVAVVEFFALVLQVGELSGEAFALLTDCLHRCRCRLCRGLLCCLFLSGRLLCRRCAEVEQRDPLLDEHHRVLIPLGFRLLQCLLRFGTEFKDLGQALVPAGEFPHRLVLRVELHSGLWVGDQREQFRDPIGLLQLPKEQGQALGHRPHRGRDGARALIHTQHEAFPRGGQQQLVPLQVVELRLRHLRSSTRRTFVCGLQFAQLLDVRCQDDARRTRTPSEQFRRRGQLVR